ncbi:F-box/kelch-repeat protein [Senna tora]|uniref:F-box/kelch-repeat protein n=1 Tax=Senna tora TaxID=362788 RepID=A0A835C7P8_9FABA|nr:F-box/kelch-repeat protein [Senna tora]
MDILFVNNVGLPSDMMFEILVRLTTSDLIGTKLVCSERYNTIKSSLFVRMHLNFWNKKSCGYLITSKIGSNPHKRNVFIHLSSNIHGVERLNELTMHPIVNHVHDLKVLGVHHGIICFIGVTHRLIPHIFLCNYSTRRVRVVDVPYASMRIGGDDYSYCTWTFDELNPEKQRWVLRMCGPLNGLYQDMSGKFIYSFGYVDDPSTRSVCVNGNIYWLSQPKLHDVDHNIYYVRFSLIHFVFKRFDISNYISPEASIPVQYEDYFGMVCAYSLVHDDFTYSTWSLDELNSRDVGVTVA